MINILIIEDEKPLAKALSYKLESFGYHVAIASNGEEGITELSKGIYDLALLDLMMPFVDGWKVLEETKKKEIKTKIIVTSNLSQSEDIEKAKKLGAVDFLVKAEVSLSEIANKVQNNLK